jgi:hypothetical protein
MNSVVAIIERSAGNETVGDMWFETKIFDDDTPISKIVKWSDEKKRSGKLIITVPDNI